MPLSEADTRAKLIDPTLHSRGWKEDLIRREEIGQGIDIIEGKPKFRDQSELSPEQLIDPDYRLKQLEKLNRGKLSITCSKCHRYRRQGEAGA